MLIHFCKLHILVVNINVLYKVADLRRDHQENHSVCHEKKKKKTNVDIYCMFPSHVKTRCA